MLNCSLNGRGVSRRVDTCICIAESLYCSPETMTALLISYTPIQNKMLKKVKIKMTNWKRNICNQYKRNISGGKKCLKLKEKTTFSDV